MYTMVTNSLALVLVTVIGGLVFSALEVPNVRTPPTSSRCFPDRPRVRSPPPQAPVPPAHAPLAQDIEPHAEPPEPHTPAPILPQQNSVQTEYAAFMSVLQTQLSMVPNGNATYATLIGNYMDDPTQMVDFWGPTTHTLYLFAFTIVTTIGYGSFAPKTAPGQIFCIVYILARARGAPARAARCLCLRVLFRRHRTGDWDSGPAPCSAS